MDTKLQLLVRRVAARILGDYTPPTLEYSGELLAELDAATRLGPGGSEWAVFATEIRDALRRAGADHFLRLPPIAKTLHSRQRSHTGRYLSYLLASPRCTGQLRKALTESAVGHPLVNPHYPLSSPLLVQHGYHLIRLMESTDCDPSRLDAVVEFGGGYGSFFRLLRNLGYRGRYVICDLPVMCALQRFYLRNVFPGEAGAAPANLQWLSSDDYGVLRQNGAGNNRSLFVATWSLSETPLAVRSAVEPVLDSFSYILFAYQREFAGYDNRRYFEALQQRLATFDWQHEECPIYRGNYYLIGQNTGVTRALASAA
jgi:hypothetical protein